SRSSKRQMKWTWSAPPSRPGGSKERARPPGMAIAGHEQVRALLGHRQQLPHEVDPVPEVRQAQVLVRAVLLVVVVGDGDDDRRLGQEVVEEVEGERAAQGRKEDAVLPRRPRGG